jgi:CopG family nickel-responsive transcriptional regulator
VAAAQAYESRSEAIRDLIRSVVETHRLSAEATGDCVANLSYVYNHDTRDLAQRHCQTNGKRQLLLDAARADR